MYIVIYNMYMYVNCTIHVHNLYLYQLTKTAECIEYSSLGGWLYGLVQEGCGSSQLEYLDLQNQLFQWSTQHLWQLVVSQHT